MTVFVQFPPRQILYIVLSWQCNKISAFVSYFISHDDGGSKYLWNVGQFLQYYTTQRPRRQSSSSLLLLTETLRIKLHWEVRCTSDVWNVLYQRFPNFHGLRPPSQCFMNFTPRSTQVNSNKQIWHKVHLITYFLAYFPETKVGSSNHQSVCLCPPLITFEPLGRFSWNLVRR
jgi:hypothetical protein